MQRDRATRYVTRIRVAQLKVTQVVTLKVFEIATIRSAVYHTLL